ncbi:molybdate transporter 1 [Apiospora arundinis]
MPPQHPNGPPPPPPPVTGKAGPKTGQRNGNGKPGPYSETDNSSAASDSDSESGSGWSGDETTLTSPSRGSDTSSHRGGHGKRGRSHDRGHSRSKTRGKSYDKGRGEGRKVRRSRSRMRGTSRLRYHHLPRESSSAFGIPHQSPRIHHTYDHIYTLDGDRVFVPPPPAPRQPPVPAAPPIIVQQQNHAAEIEKIRDEAYLSGRKDEKDRNRQLDEMSADHRPPRTSSRARAGFRHVPRTIERHAPRREARREPRRKTRDRVLHHHPPYPDNDDDDLETVESYSSAEDEGLGYRPEYRRTEYRHRTVRRGDGANYHHRTPHVYRPQTPPSLASSSHRRLWERPSLRHPPLMLTSTVAVTRIPRFAVSSTRLTR